MATVEVDPGESIQDAIDANPAGTEIRLTDGVHRQQTAEPKQGTIFSQTGGAVLNGSRDLTGAGWVADGGNWKLTGATWGTFRANSNCQSGYRCRCTEDLYFDDVLMKHVDTFADPLGSGNWFFDYATDTIYVGDNPAGASLVEQCDKTFAIGGTTADVDDVTVNGLFIEKYANLVQYGAIGSHHNGPVYMGDNWEINGGTVRFCHGRGVSAAGDGWQVKNMLLAYMGQLGIGGSGTNGLFEDSEVLGNNTAGFSGWESGGTKFAYCNGLTIRRIYSHHNLWDGLWCDIDNINVLIDQVVSVYNYRAGLYYEISYDAVIQDSLFGFNGAGAGSNYWNASGIQIGESQNVEIKRNRLVYNLAAQISGKQQDRPESPGAYGDYEIRNLSVHDNWIYSNGATCGLVTDYGAPVYGLWDGGWNNRFWRNHYRLDSVAANRFAWMGYDTKSYLDWIGYGNDLSDENLEILKAA